jgi:transcriptional regulator GlxA family with amidase domain
MFDAALTRPAECRTFAFLLVDGFSMMSLASAIEPLRSFNRLVGREVFRWRMVRLEEGPVLASNNLPFQAEPIADVLGDTNILFVCGGLRLRLRNERAYHAALRQAARRGIALGALSTGGYLLARAGLLKGYRCTIHWENRLAFLEEFPNLACSDKVFEIDRDRLTCSGGTAAMDLMLRLITDDFGSDIARRVASQFHHDRIRNDGDEQRGARTDRQDSFPRSLRTAIDLMEQHIEGPLDIDAVARAAAISTRQLERLFRKHANSNPARFYLALRVARAREMLLYSDSSVLSIAIATGFSSTSHLSQWFKQAYGVRPTEYRRRDLGARTRLVASRGGLT